MNWIERYLLKKAEPKSGYTILWETIEKMPQDERNETINRLVKAFMPGKIDRRISYGASQAHS